MALIKCEECGNQVSTAATACPKCGNPIGSEGIGTPLTTTQLTSKRLKIHIIFSALAFWIGLIWFICGFAADQNNPSPSPVAVILLIVGMVWYIITKIRIWWHHK